MGIETIIVAAVLIVLILIALKMGLSKKEIDAPVERPSEMIHMSGIYSIVRKSPRDDLAALRPNDWEIRRHLAAAENDMFGTPLTDNARDAIRKYWRAQTELNLREIDKGDQNGAQFYYYDSVGDCPVCAGFINKGNFFSREELYKHPEIIPPLHLGCTMTIAAMPDAGGEVRKTITNGMAPFFDGNEVPPLPDWTNIVAAERALS